MFAGWVNRSQQDVIDYLQAENWVLRDKLGDKRFAGGQSTTLADVQRSYNALSPTSMAYNPFHNPYCAKSQRTRNTCNFSSLWAPAIASLGLLQTLRLSLGPAR